MDNQEVYYDATIGQWVCKLKSGITGYGNTKEAAIKDCQNKLNRFNRLISDAYRDAEKWTNANRPDTRSGLRPPR